MGGRKLDENKWAVGNGMKINPVKSKALRFTRVRVKNPLGYCLGDQKIPELSSCKYWEKSYEAI